MSDVTELEAESTAPAEGVPAPGDVIADKYEVEKVIGTGGMGSVVAARHVQLGKRVAIKVLHGDLVGDPVTVKRFLREAQATVDLRSEHAALVSDVGVLDDGTPYIIMEHLEGRDLEAVLAEEGPLPLADAIDYVLQASVAVADAHHNGLVHRDLKPGNLFLTRAVDGTPLVKVLDFGITKKISKASAEQQRLTTTGIAVGTPLFMSPEQIRDAKSVDHRADIWAFGAVLHELLSGGPPFEAETITALSAMIAADDPPPLRSLRPELPEEIELAVLRCLEKRPQDRYEDVAEFVRAIEPFAPARAQHLVRRIERILGGSVPSPRITANWHPQDDLADTMVSTHPDGEAEGGSSPPPPPGTVTHSALASSSPLGQTTGAQDAFAPPKSGSPRLIVSVLAAASLVAILLWTPWSQPPQDATPAASAAAPPASPAEAPSVATAVAVPGEPSSQPSATVPVAASPAPSSSAVASSAASQTASPTRPASTRTGQPQPPPSAPPAPKPSYNLLDERK